MTYITLDKVSTFTVNKFVADAIRTSTDKDYVPLELTIPKFK